MCLERVTYPHRISHGKAIGLGFKSGIDSITPRVNKIHGQVKYAKPGVWYKCDDICLEDNVDNTYKGGFHILLTARDAESYQNAHNTVYLVEYSNILHIGTQCLFSSMQYVPCVIAEKIRYLGKASKGGRRFYDLKTDNYIGLYK